MAYWGYPLHAPDHAARAIRAALALRRRMEEVNRTLKAEGLGPFGLRTGIATGTVTVGEFGNARFASHTAIGRAVNLAQRLQALAAPGEILVSPSTRRSLVGRVQKTTAKSGVKVIPRGLPVVSVWLTMALICIRPMPSYMRP